MKKSIIFLGILGFTTAFAQQQNTNGKVGVNTDAPTETLDVKGTAKIQELPKSGEGKIYNGTATKAATFTGTRTLVADTNGVLGFVEGLPALGNDTNTNIYTHNGTLSENRTVNTNGKNLYLTGNGRIAIGSNQPNYRVDITGDGNGYDYNSVALRSFRNNSGGHGFDFFRARGNKDNPQATQKDDILGSINFLSYRKDNSFFTSSRLVSIVTGTPTDKETPTSIFLETISDKNVGKSNYTIIFHHSGNVAIGKSISSSGPVEKLEVEGSIKIKTKASYSSKTITNGSTTPVPDGGAGTIVFQNGHFFGWIGSAWKQLDN